VIRRDGTVVEARIVKPSGIRAMDKSVERALELKFIAPFPEDAKDSERLFYINFDLKTKRLL
jgi:outer membrane biosynthesis protein TonB